MWYLAVHMRGEKVGIPIFFVGVVLVLIPAAATVNLTHDCNAWIKDGTRRCRNTRKGLMIRCQHHQGQFVINPDVIALITGFITAVNGILAWQILQHASAIHLLPSPLISMQQ
ncbi:hypothetical protein AN911_23015 [Mycobacteroides immunogenum]|uniref:Uncharacterized protein n=1 Tax=Mycobacteroides immunogenum TaxID=83262 RepID=A0A7V8LL71_9MYCO|nr:hypothetical protein BAB75_10190 [Mycobacteroides immunogenum]RIU10842.1 hypothetical protein D2F01_16205 [Mycobacteroides abscessus]KIU38175.1 hypothetical protein TL11_23510 [Mycobacteroides immunogenum]KPG04562.1 hypothetical protein AN909_22620 [Mycobacteroides immunogenum]KPG05299.1 hypothetical protein AN908_22960 [Mycobacteroides immunogenum]